VLAVYEATKFAVERARCGHGVHFIEVKTTVARATPSTTTSYVPKEELDWWAKENDPVDRYVKQLVQGGWAEERELKAIETASRSKSIRRPMPASTSRCGGETALGVCTPTSAAPEHGTGAFDG